ncbi:hypothetical protein ABW19_dt0205408 [Dactylella cylindrospora]|nr:hypothetical protein ABW19_dt0205408 [Dactylella cylindrospora]
MRVSIPLFALTIIAGATAADILEELAARRWFWLSNPGKCGTNGCSRPTCGASDKQCGYDEDCGTWAGIANSCCKVLGGDPDLTCGTYGDVIENFSFSSGGEPTIVTEADVFCAADQNFVVSIPDLSGRNVCCPMGKDAIIQLEYDENLTDVELKNSKCIDPVESTSGSTPSDEDEPSTSGTGSSTPSSTASTTDAASSSSSSPNAASKVQAFALAPIAFMALAAL